MLLLRYDILEFVIVVVVAALLMIRAKERLRRVNIDGDSKLLPVTMHDL